MILATPHRHPHLHPHPRPHPHPRTARLKNIRPCRPLTKTTRGSRITDPLVFGEILGSSVGGSCAGERVEQAGFGPRAYRHGVLCERTTKTRASVMCREEGGPHQQVKLDTEAAQRGWKKKKNDQIKKKKNPISGPRASWAVRLKTWKVGLEGRGGWRKT